VRDTGDASAYHDMGSFLISEVRGVRLAGSPR
jgi:2-succinyl-5-enolpyruvyl-6-hydroxy-3-cyclohexene-1-carboxylate synthase